MLKKLLLNVFVRTLALACILLLYKTQVLERFLFPWLERYIKRGHLIYAFLAKYYILAYSLPMLLGCCCQDKGGCCETRPARRERLQDRLKEARQLLIDALPGFLAALFSATLCKVTQEKRIFFTCIFICSRLVIIDVSILRLGNLRPFFLMLGDLACLFLFLLSIFPQLGNGILDNFGGQVYLLAGKLLNLTALVVSKARGERNEL